ncbi:MAG TPA: TlpA disulfide reductase family protein [Lacipirellulaceae bacterium]|nr:TlpA disulfide reductase family protein [Lacipirellulaceae bacterium]
MSIGRRFTYRSADSGISYAEIKADAFASATEWQCYVIGCDADGYSRILFSQGPVAGNRARQQAFASEGFVDISASGEIIENATITPLANPTVIFPRLPDSAKELATGWSCALRVDDTRREFCASADAQPTHEFLHFTELNRMALDATYLASRDREYEFDCELGLVHRARTILQRGSPTDRTSSSETAWLVDVTEMEGPNENTLKTSAAEYFDACAEYQQFIELALWDLSNSVHWLQKAVDALELARPAIVHPVVQHWLERKLALLAQERSELVDGNKRLEQVIGKPAPPWQAVDLDGAVCASADFLGQPVVLCFWDRGCAWSLRTLLALNGLATEMRDRSVAFLGVTSAKDVELARLVWQSLGIRFPTVIDHGSIESIATAYLVDGYPATAVVDSNGVLRRIRSGHSFAIAPTLAAEIAKLESEHRATGLRVEI